MVRPVCLLFALPYSFISGNIMRKLVLVLTTLGLSWMANSHEYIVKTKLYQQDKLINSPTLMVKENEAATISLDPLQSDYQLNITLNEVDENSVSVATNIRVDDQSISPEMLVNYGEEASIMIEHKKLSLTIERAK